MDLPKGDGGRGIRQNRRIFHLNQLITIFFNTYVHINVLFIRKKLILFFSNKFWADNDHFG